MIDQPKKKKKRPYNLYVRLRWFLVSAILIVLGFVGIAAILPVCGCSPAVREVMTYETTVIDVDGEAARSQIEQQFNIILPDTASNLYYYYKTYRVFFMQTRFDLPSDDASAFLDSIDHMCFEQPLTDNLMPFGSPESKKPWWQPRSATHFMGAENCGDNPYWQLMVDQSDDDIWIVYILGYSQ